MKKLNFLKILMLSAVVTTSAHASNPASMDYVNSRIYLLKAELQAIINQAILSLQPTPPTTYTLCQQAEGGIIVELNAAGTHGIVVAMNDMDGAPQNAFGIRYTAPNDPSQYSNNSDGHNNYLDWRFPSIYELGVAMTASQGPCSALGFITNANYWVSNLGTYLPFIMEFPSQDINNSLSLTTTGYVRGVRTF